MGIEAFDLVSLVQSPDRCPLVSWPSTTLLRVATPARFSLLRTETESFSGTLETGHLALLSHGSIFEADWTNRHQIHFLHFRPEDVDEVIAHSSDGRKPELHSTLNLDEPIIRGLFSSLINEAESAWPNGALYAEWIALASLRQAVRSNLRNAPSCSDGPQTLTPRQLARVLSFIDANIYRNITLGELSQQAELSKFYFARCFRGSLGASPVNYITKLRMERAHKLLEDGRHSVLAVAAACGYENPSHFARLFRKHHGVTPSNFARNHTSEVGADLDQLRFN